jgi:hypothetical protein
MQLAPLRAGDYVCGDIDEAYLAKLEAAGRGGREFKLGDGKLSEKK